MGHKEAHNTVKQEAKGGRWKSVKGINTFIKATKNDHVDPDDGISSPKNSSDTSRSRGQQVRAKGKFVNAIQIVADSNKVPSDFSNKVPSDFSNKVPSDFSNKVPSDFSNKVPAGFSNKVPTFSKVVSSEGRWKSVKGINTFIKATKNDHVDPVYGISSPKNSSDTGRSRGQQVRASKGKFVKAIQTVKDTNKVPTLSVVADIVSTQAQHSLTVGEGRLSPGCQSNSSDNYSPNAQSPDIPSPDRRSPVRRSPDPRSSGRLSPARFGLHRLRRKDSDMDTVAASFMAVMRAKMALFRSVGKKSELIPLLGTPLRSSVVEELANPEVYGVLSAIKANQQRRDNKELMTEFDDVMRRIRQALENVNMVENVPSLTLPQIAERLHRKLEERDTLLKKFKQFGFDIGSRIEILMDLKEWFKFHADLGKEVLTQNQMEAVIENTEKIHNVLSSSLDMFIVGGRAMAERSEPLIYATNKILGNPDLKPLMVVAAISGSGRAFLRQMALGKKEALFTTKALAESAVKWYLAVSEVKEVCETLVGRTRNGPLWKSMVFSLEQFNELMIACDMTYKLLKERKKLCAENQAKLKTILKEVETSTRDVDLLRKRVTRSTEELTEIRREMECLESKKLDLTSKIQELTCKLAGLEATVQKLGISTDDTTDQDIPSDATEGEILDIYRMEMVQKQLKMAKENIKNAQDSLKSMKNELSAERARNKKLQRQVAKERKALKKISKESGSSAGAAAWLQDKGIMDLVTAEEMGDDDTVTDDKAHTGKQGETVGETDTKTDGLLHMAGADAMKMFDVDTAVDEDSYPDTYTESVDSTQESSQTGRLDEDDLFQIQQDIMQMLKSAMRFRSKVLPCIPAGSAPKPDPDGSAPHPDTALRQMEGLVNEELLFEPREVLEAVFTAVKEYIQKMEGIFPEKMEETLAMKKRRRSILFRQKLERRLTQASLEVNVVPELFPETSKMASPQPEPDQDHIHVPASQLKSNIQLLKDALKRKQISAQQHKTALVTIKERLEIPRNRLENILELYVRFKRAFNTRETLMAILNEEQVRVPVRSAITRRIGELRETGTRYITVWQGVMSQAHLKCQQIDKTLYQMFLKLRLQSGVWLHHPLLQGTNQDDLLAQASDHLTRAQMQDLLCTGAAGLKATTLPTSVKGSSAVKGPAIGGGFFCQNMAPIRNVNASNRRSSPDDIPRRCHGYKHQSAHSRDTSNQRVVPDIPAQSNRNREQTGDKRAFPVGTAGFFSSDHLPKACRSSHRDHLPPLLGRFNRMAQ